MPRIPKVIGVGTDCSGMEAPIQAMRNLGVSFEHRFSCDIDKFARATIEANFPDGKLYKDVTTRDNAAAPPSDLYVAGFPCQPFSYAGLGQGFEDLRGRGKIFFDVRDYIAKQRPRAFVLENVKGLVTKNEGTYFAAILKALDQLGEYNVSHKVLNTKHHGVPHNRERVYIVGIRRDVDRGTFSFPEPIPCPSIELFLDSRPSKSVLAAAALPTSRTARVNIVAARQQLEREGSNPDEDAWIIDCDSSEDRTKWMRDVSPCITCCRHQGHWVTNRGRRFARTEMARLQGMDPTKFRQVVSEVQLGKQLGNTMSVNVLERLLVRLLPAASLTASDPSDRWADGSAVRHLARTRDLGFEQQSHSLLQHRGRQPRPRSGGKAAAASSGEQRKATAAAAGAVSLLRRRGRPAGKAAAATAGEKPKATAAADGAVALLRRRGRPPGKAAAATSGEKPKANVAAAGAVSLLRRRGRPPGKAAAASSGEKRKATEAVAASSGEKLKDIVAAAGAVLPLRRRGRPSGKAAAATSGEKRKAAVAATEAVSLPGRRGRPAGKAAAATGGEKPKANAAADGAVSLLRRRGRPPGKAAAATSGEKRKAIGIAAEAAAAKLARRAAQ